MPCRALLALFLACPIVCLAAPPAAPASSATPAPPQIPEVLKPLKPRIGTKRFEVGGTFGPLLYLTAFRPLSDEQWAAIEQLGVRGFYLAGRGFGDAAELESLQLLNMLISEADLARLKADLPKVQITFTPMKPEHLVKLERYEAVRDMPEVLKAAKIGLQPDPLDAARTMLVFPGSGKVTRELWDATEPLRTRFTIRAFQLQGQAGDDAAVARLVPLDPTTLILGGSPVTDAGLSHVAAMQSLRRLDLSRCGAVTPAAAAIVANHPTIESLVPPASWGDDSRVLASVLTNPRLKVIALGQRQASDAICAVLARHPAVEELSLSAYGTAGLTNKGIESLSTMPKLRKLELSHAHFTYDDGLAHLAKLAALEALTLSGVDVAAADMQRLKEALPKLQVKFTPMDAAYRSRWEKLVAARARAVALAKLPEAERGAKLAELQGDPEAFKAIQAELKGLLPAADVKK